MVESGLATLAAGHCLNVAVVTLMVRVGDGLPRELAQVVGQAFRDHTELAKLPPLRTHG